MGMRKACVADGLIRSQYASYKLPDSDFYRKLAANRPANLTRHQWSRVQQVIIMQLAATPDICFNGVRTTPTMYGRDFHNSRYYNY